MRSLQATSVPVMLKASLLFSLLILVGPALRADEPSPVFKLCSQNEPLLPHIGPATDHASNPGILVELITQTAKASGFEALILRMPWKRCIHNLKTGEIDALFAVVWQPERESWGHFPKSENGELHREQRLWSGVYSIFTHKDSNLTWNGKQVGNVKTGIASPLGYVVHKQIHDMGVANKTSLSVREGFRLLSLNRLDGYVIEEQAGRLEARQHNIQHLIRKLPKPFLVADWYMPLSHQFVKKYPQRSQLLWQKLSKIRETQTPTLLEKYMNKL